MKTNFRVKTTFLKTALLLLPALAADGALLKSGIVRGVLRMLGKLGIDARRQLAVTTYCVHSFFDAYLKGTGGSRLSISSPLYPEIQVLE